MSEYCRNCDDTWPRKMDLILKDNCERCKNAMTNEEKLDNFFKKIESMSIEEIMEFFKGVEKKKPEDIPDFFVKLERQLVNDCLKGEGDE